MVTITEWLETKDYGVGLVLLGLTSRNRILVQSLSRKKNPDKLEYELKKIAADMEARLNPVKVPVKKTVKEKKILPSMKELVVEQLKESRNIIRSGAVISPEELPQEIRKLWDQNRDSYKLLRSLHEKLKLMEKATDVDRAPLVVQISDLDESIRDNWTKIDAWDPNAPLLEKVIPAIDHKRINANRKFICTNVRSILVAKNEVKADAIRTKLQERYDELRAAGEDVDPETIQKLNNCGIK